MRNIRKTYSIAMIAICGLGAAAAQAHETTFPAKRLAQLQQESLTFEEKKIPVNLKSLGECEAQHSFKLSKGELAGNLYLGRDSKKSVVAVVAFLDGHSKNGDIEFGAAVTADQKIYGLKVYSSGESAATTADEFLATMRGKDLAQLETMKREEKDDGKSLMIELAMKSICRVSASFAKN